MIIDIWVNSKTFIQWNYKYDHLICQVALRIITYHGDPEVVSQNIIILHLSVVLNKTTLYCLKNSNLLTNYIYKTICRLQARQRASVKWILSKAFNNRVPENLKEPFYRDHEGQEHLKPQIVVGLGNASLYCQTLSNLYSDPNYQSLNHWSILQTLTRKGVPLGETAEPLTETVLIQTNPLRIVRVSYFCIAFISKFLTHLVFILCRMPICLW